MTVPGLPAKMIGSTPGPMPLRGDVGLQGKTAAKGGDVPPFSRLLQEKQGALNRAEKGGKRAAGAEKAPREALPEGKAAESTPAEELPGEDAFGAIPVPEQRLQAGAVPFALSARPSKDGGEGGEAATDVEGKERSGRLPVRAAARQLRHLTAHPAAAAAEAGEGRQAEAPGGVKPVGQTVPGSGAVPLVQEPSMAAAAGSFPAGGGTDDAGRQGKTAPAGAVPGQGTIGEGRAAAAERPAPSRPVAAAAPTGGTGGGDTAGVETARPGSEGFSGPGADLLRSEADGPLNPATQSPMVDPPRAEAEPTARVAKLSDPAAGKDDRPAIPSAGPSAPGVAIERVGGREMLAADGGRGALTPPATGAEGEPRSGLSPLSGGSQTAPAEGMAREGRAFETILGRGEGFAQPAMEGQAVRAGQRTTGAGPLQASGRPESTPAALRIEEIADPAVATDKRDAVTVPRDGDAAPETSPRDAGLSPQRPSAAAKGDFLTESPSAAPPAPGMDGEGGAAASSRGAGDQDSVGGSLRAAGETAPATAKAAGPVPPFTGARAQAIMEQIVAARQQISPEGGRIRVTLSPAELGDVDLEIVVRRHRVEVVMIAERPDVQQLLQSRGEEIKSALLRQEMRVEDFQVLLQDRGQGNQHHSAAWTAMDDQRRGRESGGTAGVPEREGVPPRERPVPGRHRGLVSVFA